MGGIGKRGIAFQIWRSFMIFILIPVVLLNMAIFYLLYNIENTAKEMVATKLAHAQFLLEQNITDSLELLGKIGNNYSIQKMSSLKRPLKAEDYGTLLEVRKLQNTMLISNDAYSVHILCNGSDIAWIDNELCVNLSDYYPSAYALGQLSVDELKMYGHQRKEITFHPYVPFKKGETSENGIFYTTVLTTYAKEDSGATAIVFFNEDNLQGILGEISLWDGFTYIMDAQGQILYEMGECFTSPVSIPLGNHQKDVRILPNAYFGKDNFAMACNITSGLQIVSVIPESSLYMSMDSLRIFIWILNITTLLMCLSLSLALAKKRSQILSSTLELMETKEEEQGNVFSAIYHSVSNMVETNTSLKMELGNQKELLQNVFWSRMLSVNTMTDEEIRRLAKSAGIEGKADGYCLLLAGFGSSNDVKAEEWNQLLQRRQQILERLHRLEKESVCVGSCGIDQIVILISLDRENLETYQDYVRECCGIWQEMQDESSMLVCVGSCVFENLRDIYHAYTMCGNQMNLADGYRESGRIIWCRPEELGTESTFYYTDELKNQIIMWIKSGQQELVKEGFRKILEENYLKRHISENMEQLLAAKLKLTLLGAYDTRMTLNLSEIFEHIDKIQTDAWLFSYILRVAMDMCGHYMAGIRSHEDGLQKKIVAYVEEHFMEYGFGLSAIAEHCSLSEAYFSQIFKELIGENFSSYVEKKKMEYAYGLIMESDITIDEVAEKTGYSNTNAFRKAYKRFYGVTPSQTRKNRVSS